MIALAMIVALDTAAAAGEWRATITRLPRGDFAQVRPFEATYNFSWSGISAASADIRCQREPADYLTLDGQGHTFGVARVLWKFDFSYHSCVRADTLRPVGMQQTQTERRKFTRTDQQFTDAGVETTRVEGKKSPKHTTYLCNGLNDLFSALLYVRSQPLADRDVYRLIVYPETTPYLATITVLGRESFKSHAGNYRAIKMDLRLEKITKKDELVPHKKFKRASVWLSDDSDRILLRAEAQIFVGTVAAELQSIQFGAPDK
ncbi:MAG: DUF3108 domain-containing protein [Verrucomicrobiota bacterium]|nr:DUF3108 domain-containing protein [Verrucomicrobiota bacterium]